MMATRNNNKSNNNVDDDPEDENSLSSMPDEVAGSTVGSVISSKGQSTERSSDEIGHNESKVVRRSKLLVYLVLLATALGAGALTFFLTRAQEKHEFEVDVSARHFHCARLDLQLSQ